MITLSFAFPTDELETQAVEVISDHYGYPETVLIPSTDGDGNDTSAPGPNPQSKVDFCKRSIAKYLGDIVRDRLVASTVASATDAVQARLSETVVT